jgi:hypothetical protein
MPTRRRFLAGAAATAVGGAAIGYGVDSALDTVAASAPPHVALGAQPAGLPVRQHAWAATLSSDADGNALPPRFDRLLFFDVKGKPSGAYARVLEAALRTLERRYRWGPSGLLFTVGWAPDYFERVLSREAPLPKARALSQFELPAIDDYHACIHLACDDEARLAAIETALAHGGSLHGASGPLDLASVLRLRETRTGFVGAGLPAAHQQVGGIPPGKPVTRAAPLFMGFKSSLRGNQASEDEVSIPDGAFAEGTTMQASYMQLRLEDWYEHLDEAERVARMYDPQMTVAEQRRITTEAKGDPVGYEQAVTRYGVLGHSQTSARARRNGKAIILRRDFDTVDGGQAGLHFVAVQRSIEDFVKTRTAMNATSAQLRNPSITDTVNNGINEFIFVLKRGNYILPPRPDRSFPQLPGRERALA